MGGTGQGSSQELGSSTSEGVRVTSSGCQFGPCGYPPQGAGRRRREAQSGTSRGSGTGGIPPNPDVTFLLQAGSDQPLSLAALREQTTQTEAKDMVFIFCRPVGLNIFSHGPFLSKTFTKGIGVTV